MVLDHDGNEVRSNLRLEIVGDKSTMFFGELRFIEDANLRLIQRLFNRLKRSIVFVLQLKHPIGNGLDGLFYAKSQRRFGSGVYRHGTLQIRHTHAEKLVQIIGKNA